MLKTAQYKHLIPKGYRRVRMGEKLTPDWTALDVYIKSRPIRLNFYKTDSVGYRINGSENVNFIYLIKK